MDTLSRVSVCLGVHTNFLSVVIFRTILPIAWVIRSGLSIRMARMYGKINQNGEIVKRIQDNTQDAVLW